MTKTVKAYGLIDLTKKQYITIQAIVFSLIAAIFGLSFIFDLNPIAFGYFRELIIVVFLLEIGETYFILRRF